MYSPLPKIRLFCQNEADMRGILPFKLGEYANDWPRIGLKWVDLRGFGEWVSEIGSKILVPIIWTV